MPVHQTSRAIARFNAAGIGPLPDAASTSLFVDQYGNLLTSQATLSAGEDLVNNRQIVEQRWQYAEYELTGSVNNYQVSIKSGILHGIIFVDTGGGGYLLIKDTPNGTGTTMFPLVANTPNYTFDVAFTTGLYITANNTSGTSPLKFVVLYRENAS